MTIETITTTEIYMEGDSTITVETQVVVEAISLWTREDEQPEFTPMFAPLFAPDYDETLVIAAPQFATFVAPVLHDLAGNPTWLC